MIEHTSTLDPFLYPQSIPSAQFSLSVTSTGFKVTVTVRIANFAPRLPFSYFKADLEVYSDSEHLAFVSPPTLNIDRLEALARLPTL
ncbi:hypothetical protein FRC01_011853, partial [Tulasnella sp. 417]